ncbi:MAG: DUF4197 domain-containing protein [Deltaproteobacteria bacterium]|nr:DUF4197 domain-containing protein [Deltaproteobacteria bacterium]
MLWTLVICLLSAPVTGEAGWRDLFNKAKDSLSGDNESADAPLRSSDIIGGLKEALKIGTDNAVGILSESDGFFKNPDVKILLPESIQKTEKLIRVAGFGDHLDAFELSMNRAAEQAVPAAKSIFLDSIKQMTFSDAKAILNGAQDAATRYFQEKTTDRLHALFKPIAHNTMSEVGVTRTFQDLNQKIAPIPMLGEWVVDLDTYVTDKTLDGLFLMLAREEQKIRENPGARVTDLLKKVFK